MPSVTGDGLTLVVLAAGMGSRFGGTKQLVGVGPHGETIVDYSVRAAAHAGFTRVVMVVRSEIAMAVDACADRWRSEVEVTLVAQDTAAPASPTGRSKPPGTGHAVLVARPHVAGSFAVINADDLYTPDSYRLLAGHLRGPDPRHAVVGFRLENTLIVSATVNRALLRMAGDRLSGIDEGAVTPCDDGFTWQSVRGDHAASLSGSELVSMNCFGFRRSVFEALARAWESFVTRADASEAELLLPDVIRDLARPGGDGVAVLPTAGCCVGVTHADDLDVVRERVAEMVHRGVLPAQVWGR